MQKFDYKSIWSHSPLCSEETVDWMWNLSSWMLNPSEERNATTLQAKSPRKLMPYSQSTACLQEETDREDNTWHQQQPKNNIQLCYVTFFLILSCWISHQSWTFSPKCQKRLARSPGLLSTSSHIDKGHHFATYRKWTGTARQGVGVTKHSDPSFAPNPPGDADYLETTQESQNIIVSFQLWDVEEYRMQFFGDLRRLCCSRKLNFWAT